MHSRLTKQLFVHRVGRVARAGRSGAAYSLVDSNEVRVTGSQTSRLNF